MSQRNSSFALAVILSLCAPSVVCAGGTQSAYEEAKKCAVAGGIAADDRHKAGDETKADMYRAKSRLSFDTAYKLGGTLGLTDKQVTRDMDFAQVSELPRMLRDQSYYLNTVSSCKALGLM